jgi:hypothetical protein
VDLVLPTCSLTSTVRSVLVPQRGDVIGRIGGRLNVLGGLP